MKLAPGEQLSYSVAVQMLDEFLRDTRDILREVQQNAVEQDGWVVERMAELNNDPSECALLVLNSPAITDVTIKIACERILK